jgi:hypothetical protein
MSDRELTEKEELYAQQRAVGHTKTRAAIKAYPDSNNPRQVGYAAEKRDCVSERIKELKEERAESAGLDLNVQVCRYNELYLMALEKGQLGLAKDMLARMDAIGGFDAPSKSISLKGDLSNEALTDITGDVSKDIKKFAGVIGKHAKEKPTSH